MCSILRICKICQFIKNIFIKEKIDSEYLLRKYIPSLYNLLIKRGYNKWHEINSKVNHQIFLKEDVRTNLFLLLNEIETKRDLGIKSFPVLVNEIITRVLNVLPHKEKRIWYTLNGKFDNLNDWNFLNPIGELSALDKVLLNSDYELIEIEAAFPNGKTKDFLFQNKINKSKLYVEVLNIHIPEYVNDYDKIKKIIINKLNEKILIEIANVNDSYFLKSLCFFPIVWYLEKDILKDEHTFFSDFKKTYGLKYGIKHTSMGICTYYKFDGEYKFAEASSIFELLKSFF
jgi:hypothetical protein